MGKSPEELKAELERKAAELREEEVLAQAELSIPENQDPNANPQ